MYKNENEIQADFFKSIRNSVELYPQLGLVYATLNERTGTPYKDKEANKKFNIMQASKAKRSGALAGVWDVFVGLQSSDGNWSSLYIEFKMPNKKLTKNQEIFRNLTQKYNPKTDFKIFRDADEAFLYVLNYLGLGVNFGF